MSDRQPEISSSTRSWLESIINSSNDAIISKTLDSIITSWNPAAQAMFGYTADEMIGTSIRRLIPEDRAHEEDDILARISQGERVDYFETQRLTKNGTLIDISVSISPIHDDAGAVIGASKIARDITQRKLDRALLEESESRFRALADNISQFAWMADRKGWLFWYNQRWFDYTGTTLEEMQGWGWRAVHHPDHVDRVVERLQYSWDTGEPWEDTFPLRSKEGEYRWFLSRALPIRDEAGAVTMWVGTNTDITERIDHDRQVQLLMQEVNHRTKNMLSLVQAIARQTTGATHEEFNARFSERIQALSRNQDILVNNEWRGIGLNELCRHQLTPFEDEIGTRITFEGPDVMLTAASAQTLGIALHELATNASKYGALSNDTGSVAISWTIPGTELSPGGLTLQWQEAGGPDVTEPETMGFGTGVLEKMASMGLGGTVKADFEKTGLRWCLETKDGSIFEGGKRPSGLAGKGDQIPDSSRHCILLVEDEALVGIEMQISLEEAGYDVAGPAASVRQALNMIEKKKCDIAVLDINLGRENSVPVAEKLQEKGIPFIVVSGYSEGQQPEIFSGYPSLSKPVPMSRLLRLIETGLEIFTPQDGASG
ncbi:PAS domain S-box protein [Parvularcula flava]|uniref:histidine kinase n=1 Tax=Aquisalinus luteolus TaxID=1566827 RepID=A0A8J3A7G6_9PROT|nr:PAS domain S-box protein [Aquisalinus luteolus]NHK27952.1 PAS domain S-box protein [Aquisalinus luteolus]GGH97026.1 hypothetical protein GCM10011355_17240 [Aquisalinus luteolus]